MKTESKFKLLCGAILVGRVRNAFCTDATWYGIVELQIKPADGSLESVIVEYINFIVGWNERVKAEMNADPQELDCFHELLKTGLWKVIAMDGVADVVEVAPVFFKNGEVTWQCHERTN